MVEWNQVLENNDNRAEITIQIFYITRVKSQESGKQNCTVSEINYPRVLMYSVILQNGSVIPCYPMAPVNNNFTVTVEHGPL